MTTIQELHIMVIAYNRILNGRVNQMNIVQLLRNVHPAYRSLFASQLYREGKLSKSEKMEFIETD